MAIDTLRLVEHYIDSNWRKAGGQNIWIRCPNPEHDDDGARPRCHLHLEKLLFNCFSCGAKGTLKSALRMKHAPPEILDSIQVARFIPPRDSALTPEVFLPEPILGAFDHPPTDWPFIDLAANGTPLSEDWLVYAEQLPEHGIGYDFKHHRVTIPIRDGKGRLVAISGRTTVGASNKYIIYKRELEDQTPRNYAPKTHNYLWREWLLDDSNGPIIVTEGFKACLYCVLCGYNNTVAILGNKASSEQLLKLARLGKPVWFMLDNDVAGRSGTQVSAITLYRKGIDVRIVQYDTHQPDGLNKQQLARALASPLTMMQARMNRT